MFFGKQTPNGLSYRIGNTSETVVHPTCQKPPSALDLVNGFGVFCHLGCIFRLSGDSDSTGKIEFIVINLKKSFKDSFVVHRTNKTRAKCLIQGVANECEITRCGISTNSRRRFRNSLTSLPLHIIPELVSFPNDETSRVKLMLHISKYLVHGYLVNCLSLAIPESPNWKAFYTPWKIG